jgi:hypothetical protein
MKLRALAIAAAAAGLLAGPQVAEAAWGQVVGDLNLRACASVRCGKIVVMPRGARVWIDGVAGGWYHINFNGIAGFASASYIAAGPTVYVQPQPVYRPPPRAYTYYPAPPRYPRYGAWYNVRPRAYGGRRYVRPGGIYFNFRFGG